MGKIVSVMTKPLKEFNLESRAHKVISRDKPIPAPKYKQDQLEYERILKENPKVFEESLSKDNALDKNLKSIFVTSKDPMPQAPQDSSSATRPLPLSRKPVQSFEFGFPEPEKVPYGRSTLRSTLKFILDHQNDPQQNSIENISEQYKLPVNTVGDIIKYFKVHEIYVPTERVVKANFIGPVVPRKKIVTHVPKELPSGKNNKDNT